MNASKRSTRLGVHLLLTYLHKFTTQTYHQAFYTYDSLLLCMPHSTSSLQKVSLCQRIMRGDSDTCPLSHPSFIPHPHPKHIIIPFLCLFLLSGLIL